MPVPQALAAGDGLVASIHADARTATVDGVSVMLAWECRMSAYRTQYDMIIPISGEVPHLIAECERPSFNGTFKRIDCASGHTDETGGPWKWRTSFLFSTAAPWNHSRNRSLACFVQNRP